MKVYTAHLRIVHVYGYTVKWKCTLHTHSVYRDNLVYIAHLECVYWDILVYI